MAMLKNASLLIADFEGTQKEEFYCNIRCLAVRKETEWLEIIKFGISKLISLKKFLYQNTIKCTNLMKNKKKILNVYSFGNASRLIVNQIKKLKKNFYKF
jgi:UDP-N-acetylglucosamine 2-epimerase